MNPVKLSDDSYNPNSLSCAQRINESKWTDVTLVTGAVVFAVLGILAATGAFSFMGTTAAINLSYVLQSAALVLSVTVIVRLVSAQFVKKDTTQETENEIESFHEEKNKIEPIESKQDEYRPELKHIQFQQAVEESIDELDTGMLESFRSYSIQGPREKLKVYCKTIMSQEEFKKDPIAYVNQWTVGRGNPFPDTMARDLIMKNLPNFFPSSS